MAERYRVEKQVDFEGTANWHVVDAHQDGRPAAEFEDEDSARDHAARLEAEDDTTPNTDDGGGDVSPTVP